MFRNNELHVRDPAYMMSHGEGGRYKETNAAPINEAMTRRLVRKAIGLWKSYDRGRSLEVLSDALHQAEDRGSHGEGNAFTGHDVRLSIIASRPDEHSLFDWEKEGLEEFRRKTGRSSPKGWQPDDLGINKRGAVLAVGYAKGVLKAFATGVRGAITLPGEKMPPKRVLKFKGFLPVTSRKRRLGGLMDVIPFIRSGGRSAKLKKAFTELAENLGADDREVKQAALELKNAYEAAASLPETVELSEDQASMVEEGMKFYETVTKLAPPRKRRQMRPPQPHLMTAVFLEAKKQFKKYPRKYRKKKNKKLREAKAKEYRAEKVGQAEPEEREVVKAAINAAYSAVFRGERLKD